MKKFKMTKLTSDMMWKRTADGGEIIQRINENEIGRYRMKIIYKSPWHVDCGAVNRGKMLTKNILLDDDIEIWTKHWTFERKRQEFWEQTCGVRCVHLRIEREFDWKKYHGHENGLKWWSFVETTEKRSWEVGMRLSYNEFGQSQTSNSLRRKQIGGLCRKKRITKSIGGKIHVCVAKKRGMQYIFEPFEQRILHNFVSDSTQTKPCQIK
jgi:hypothetical protein